MPPADFYDAHQRHHEDAENLYKQGRLANADHLFGLAAECGLKCLMTVLGMQSTNGLPPKADRKHIDQLRARYDTYCNGTPLGAQFLLPPSDPFLNWSVEQRYEHQQMFTRAIVTPHSLGTQEVALLVGKAKRGGLL